MVGERKQIHNSSFLISPTTNLFPLSRKSWGKYYDYFEEQKVEYEINNKIKYTTL